MAIPDEVRRKGAGPGPSTSRVEDESFWNAPPFSFEQANYGEILRIGNAAFRVFADSLLGSEATHDDSRFAHAGRFEDAVTLVEELAHPGSLPMRVLVWVAGNLTWGALEMFYSQPTSPADGRPYSASLRAWYRQYDKDFQAFFPEQRISESPSIHETYKDAEGIWAQLDRLVPRFADAADVPVSNSVALFLLLRDEVEALSPLTQRLDLDLDRLTRRAFHGASTAGSVVPLLTRYQTLRDQGLPAGAPLVFATMVLEAGSEAAAVVKSSIPEDNLLAAVRELSHDRQGAAVLNFGKRAVRDLPAEADQLGVTPLVEGLRALLDDEKTDLPLAIGINAPWGAGKSSVMLQLRRALERTGNNREWIPVSFDAWKYERGEQLWAAMARTIYEAAENSLAFLPWISFKMRLERGRRGRANKHLRALSLAIVGAFLLMAAIAGAGALPVLLGVAAVIGIGGDTLSGAWGLFGDPFKRAINDYASKPNYEKYLGFTSEADRDVSVMTEELTRGGKRALIVFVDDLDRCSPRYIVDVVEAVNQIFNSSHDARCAFVLGMDREMVVAGIEAAYRDSVEALRGQTVDGGFGSGFLAKLVQLSVTVPPPDQEGLGRLLTSLADWESTSDRDLKMSQVTDRRRQLGRVEAANPSAVQEAADRIAREEGLSESDRVPLDEAVRLERAELFSRDSRDVEAAERLLVEHLRPNPREIKRFDNAFRLQLHVANSSPECGLTFNLDDLVALGKSIVLRLRWPSLGDEIDADVGLLRRLEEASNNEAGRRMVPGKWEGDKDLRALLEDSSGKRRPSRLAEHVYLRVS